MNAEALAEAFHKAWERNAPHYLEPFLAAGVVPWDRLEEANRRLMVAAAREVVAELNLAAGIPPGWMLEKASPDSLLGELERRAAAGRPLLARCPNCTRTDALVTVHCAACGPAFFPLEPRRVAQLDLRMRKLLTDLDSHGVDPLSLPSIATRLPDHEEEEL